MMDLQFILMIQLSFDFEVLLEEMKMNLDGAIWKKFRSFEMEGNLIEILKNEDYDETLLTSSDDGFLYYKFRLNSTPLGKNLSLASQVNLAKHLIEYFEGIDADVVLCANFEDVI